VYIIYTIGFVWNTTTAGAKRCQGNLPEIDVSDDGAEWREEGLTFMMVLGLVHLM